MQLTFSISVLVAKIRKGLQSLQGRDVRVLTAGKYVHFCIVIQNTYFLSVSISFTILCFKYTLLEKCDLIGGVREEREDYYTKRGEMNSKL